MEPTIPSILHTLGIGDWLTLLYLGSKLPFTPEFIGSGIYVLLPIIFLFILPLYAVFRYRTRLRRWLFTPLYGFVSAFTISPLLLICLFRDTLLGSMTDGYSDYIYYLTLNTLVYYISFFVINLVCGALFTALAVPAEAVFRRILGGRRRPTAPAPELAFVSAGIDAAASAGGDAVPSPAQKIPVLLDSEATPG